ncbi:MAG TPA: hypothetical protein VGQ69_03955, partial [Gemmatimonadales bacterium]|nr:hypothetical protein [Gemmatimonadales bacterium]
MVAIAWGRGTGTVSASTAAGLPLQAGGSCPLTSTQELNSIKTWLKMMPVFRHPRCLNCHGGIPKPLKDFSTKHAGVVQMDSSDNAQTCEECHAE